MIIYYVDNIAKDRWFWPDDFNIPELVNTDASKLALIQNVRQEIDKICNKARVNYHQRAKRVNLTLSYVTILRYLEGTHESNVQFIKS